MFTLIEDLDGISVDGLVRVIKDNNQEAKKIRDELKRRNSVKSSFVTVPSASEIETKEEKESVDSFDYEDFLLECEVFEEQISCLSIDDDLESNITSLIDSVSDDQERVLLRASADYYKRALDTKKTLKELIGQMDVDDILQLRKEISGYETIQKALINVYKKKIRNSFIVVPARDGSIKFLSSVERLKTSKREFFYGLLDQISENRDSSKKKTEDVYFIGDNEVGIVYDRLDSTHIALIDVVYNGREDKGVIGDYKNSKPKLIKSLSNSEFANLQADYIHELYKDAPKDMLHQYRKGDK